MREYATVCQGYWQIRTLKIDDQTGVSWPATNGISKFLHCGTSTSPLSLTKFVNNEFLHFLCLGRSLDSPSQSHELLNDITTSSAQQAALAQQRAAHLYDDSDFETEPELPPLDASIPKDVLKKLKPKEKKRQEVLNGRWHMLWDLCDVASITRTREYYLRLVYTSEAVSESEIYTGRDVLPYKGTQGAILNQSCLQQDPFWSCFGVEQDVNCLLSGTIFLAVLQTLRGSCNSWLLTC